MHAALGFASAADMIRDGYGLKNGDIDLALKWLKLNPQREPVALKVAIAGGLTICAGERVVEAAAATTGEVLPKHSHADVQIAHQGAKSRARDAGTSLRTQRKLDALARRAPELLEAVRAGRMSATAACIAAGIEKPRIKRCPKCGHTW
jgi:hypothetical protein